MVATARKLGHRLGLAVLHLDPVFVTVQVYWYESVSYVDSGYYHFCSRPVRPKRLDCQVYYHKTKGRELYVVDLVVADLPPGLGLRDWNCLTKAIKEALWERHQIRVSQVARHKFLAKFGE